VTSLEWQSSLCEEGQGYANKHGLDMHFVHGDAFSAESKALVDGCEHAVALHACGDLHVTLLRHSVDAGVNTISISPCCYYRIRDGQYQALSTRARSSSLVLTRHDLKLPLQETVTAGQARKSRRFVEVCFRLGFDSLQRQLNRTDCYLPIPKVRKSLLKEGFKAFCLWAAKQEDLALPDDIDLPHFRKAGEERFLLVEKMETIRTLFRRPLEMWLVLDRAIYLAENNYEVDVTSFCLREVTPRNLLIHARRRS
jgi:hypothetical protein